MSEPASPTPITPMAERFRGYLPVVVDVETGGFDWNKHALLEIAAVPIELDADGNYMPGAVAHAHIAPAPGTSIDPKSLEVTGIKIGHPLRGEVDERTGLDAIFVPVRAARKKHACTRAILVGHNASHQSRLRAHPPSKATEPPGYKVAVSTHPWQRQLLRPP